MSLTTCAYTKCSATVSILYTSSRFVICPGCGGVLYKCKYCGAYNRSLAKYCRGCGRLISNKLMEKRKYGVQISSKREANEVFKRPLDMEFQRGKLFCVEVYGRIALFRSSGRYLVINPGLRSFVSSDLSLEPDERLVARPIVTDFFVYFRTNHRILGAELFRLDCLRTKSLPLETLHTGEVTENILQLDRCIIFHSDRQLKYIVELTGNLDDLKNIQVLPCECDIYRLVPSDGEQFFAIGKHDVALYKLGDTGIELVESYKTRDNIEKDELVCARRNIFYIGNGNFYRGTINEDTKSIVWRHEKCDLIEVRRMRPYERQNERGIILQHERGWLFYDCLGRQFDRGKARDGILINLDAVSMQVGDHCLVVTRDSVDLSRQTAYVYGVGRIGMKRLTSIDGLIDAFQSFDRIYLLVEEGDTRKLKGYSLTE